MSEHEYMPDDEEKISRIEYQVSRLRGILDGEKSPKKIGLVETVDNNHKTISDRISHMENELKSIKDLVKQVRVGFICLIVGIVVGGLVWGIYTIKEAVSFVKP